MQLMKQEPCVYMTRPMPTHFWVLPGRKRQDLICAILTCIRPFQPPTAVWVPGWEPLAAGNS